MSKTSHTEGLTDQGTSLPNDSRSVWVEVTQGTSKGTRARLGAGLFTVGSEEGCDLVVEDRAVSRRHATVELRKGGLRVRDLGSRNGTRYLGAKISDARVPLGGSITVGKTVLRFSPEGGEELSDKEELCGMLGHSVPARRLFAVIERVGPTDSTVLIRGETGVGKDAVARALHELGRGEKTPFVVFDCAAVQPNLVESELFGHVKGAFTGATRDRAGVLEAAGNGTLFLDEVGELPLELQPKLLRALEAREFQRVGERVSRKFRARVVAATHRDLEAGAAKGTFREDLYFRLAVAIIQVPSLRSRPEDIPLLAQRFARQVSGVDVALDPATLAALQCDPWPGNVRELRNAVERALALGDAARAPAAVEADPAGYKDARDALVNKFERDYLRSVLTRFKGNISSAARAAKLSRSYFYEMLEKHGLAGEASE